jgi:hypothetical protein
MAEIESDGELLREYVEHRSEGAFAELVERRTNLVFATASRGVTDSAAAQEVTQNVFMALARKAGRTTKTCEGNMAVGFTATHPVF